ncbi:MAG: hypothetical protein QGI33_05740 [Candidatus Brocadiia bacterium]|nr:hypothetical protein [Candidatus Brocadiia bacterium]
MTGRLSILSWGLFFVCSVLYLISAVLNRDPWAIAGSALFALGVVMFIVALRTER